MSWLYSPAIPFPTSGQLTTNIKVADDWYLHQDADVQYITYSGTGIIGAQWHKRIESEGTAYVVTFGAGPTAMMGGFGGALKLAYEYRW